mmetsp:Transcript_33286/g.56617  ORF Transcript_33286/g.56617 Transcript_33286/m.56617 type:complete len:659 (+) Transcript_33286:1233-3209(+)
MTHQLFLPASLHHHGDPPDQIGRLHAHAGGLVVETPLDGSGNLLEVRLAPFPQCIHHRPEAIQHHLTLLPERAGGGAGVDGLFLEGVEDAVDETFLQPLVDVGAPQILQHLLGGLHNHATVRFRIVLEIVHDPSQHVRTSHLVRQLLRRLDDLTIIPPIQRHPTNPKIAKELRQDLLANVLRLHPRRAHALLHHLQDDALHLLVGTVKLPRQNRHDQPGVMTRVILLHQRDDVPDRLQERRQSLPVVLQRPLPQRADDRVEALDPVGMRRLRQRRDGEGPHGPHLGLLVRQAVPHGVHELAQVGEDGASHEEGDLLHDLDARVARLPRLAGSAHRLQEREEAGHAEGRGDDGERPRGGVAHVLVGAVDVRAHRGYHGAEPRGLGEVADDLPSLHAGVVILVDQQGFDHGQDPMDVRPHQIVELVQHAIDDLDQQVTLLILQRRRHEQRQDLVEERPGAERPRPIGDLPHGRLALGRRPALDLEQERHDGALPRLVLRQAGFVRDVLHEPSEVLHVLRLDVRQRRVSRAGGTLPASPGFRGGRSDGDAVRLANVLDGLPLPLLGGDVHLESRGGLSPVGGGGAEELPAGGAERDVGRRGREEGVPLGRQDGVEGGVGPGTVAALHLPLVRQGLGQVSREERRLSADQGGLSPQQGSRAG